MEEELVDKSIEKGWLQLGFGDKIKYYELVFVFIALSLIFPILDLKEYMNGVFRQREFIALFTCFFSFNIVAYLIYRYKKSKLRLTEINISMVKSDIIKVVKKIAWEKNWKVKYIKSRAIILKGNSNSGFKFPFINEMQQIVVLWDKNRVLVNSVNYSDSLFRMISLPTDRNRKNITAITRNIQDSSAILVEAPNEKVPV